LRNEESFSRKTEGRRGCTSSMSHRGKEVLEKKRVRKEQ